MMKTRSCPGLPANNQDKTSVATIPQEGKDLVEMLGIKPQMQEDVENFSSVAGSVLCGQSLNSPEVLPLPLPSLPLPCKDNQLD